MPKRLEEFPLAWRWTQNTHARLPEQVLNSLEPIAGAVAKDLYERGEKLFAPWPSTATTICSSSERDVVTTWLRDLAIPARSKTTIVWSRELGLSLPWEAFARYWDDFCYPTSDDAFIFMSSGQVLAYDHQEAFTLRTGVA
jgi:hypothetical protein